MPVSEDLRSVSPDRLVGGHYAENFADLHPPLSRHEAAVAADRCYFCHDAPCIDACPTEIDIPLFIRQIASGVPDAAASTIFDSNILGGACARVCPTETLCEEACVREAAEGSPVEIGRLQRFATDSLMAKQGHPYARAKPSGKRVAVVGAGPAGLACAHRLAMKGHGVTIFEAKEKAGGLNEYGIAAYKVVDEFAAREVDWILGIGGIDLKLGHPIDSAEELQRLRAEFDAVFLSVGLAGVNSLAINGAPGPSVRFAVDFIAQLRQAEDLSSVPVGQETVVIGGGMTAIDAGVQSKLLGAETVSIVYRRSQDEMGASRYEQDLAASRGVRIIANAQPARIDEGDGKAVVVFERTKSADGRIVATGEILALPADQVLLAIGQKLGELPAAFKLDGGKISVSGPGRTGLPGVWAGGDCVSEGEDLTVTAVAQGRDAAEDIHASLVSS